MARVVFEAEASGGSKAGGLPHPSLFPFPPLPLSIPPKFSDKPVGGKVRSNEGEVPRLPPYKYHPGHGYHSCHYTTVRIGADSGHLGDGCNYDSTSIRLQFHRGTTIRRLRNDCSPVCGLQLH